MSFITMHSSETGGALYALRKAQQQAGTSINRLSSGERITRAADDVASLAVATGLQNSVITLRQSLNNTLQASSMLQVADGALSSIDQQLLRMKAIAVQSNGGGLTDVDRSFLDLEFQNLKEEIDRTADATVFSGAQILKSGVAENALKLETESSEGSGGQMILQFSSNGFNGRDFEMNGVTITAGTEFAMGVSLQETLNNFVTFLNASTDNRLSQASYRVEAGMRIVIEHRGTGAASNFYSLNEAGSSARNFFDVTLGEQTENDRWRMTGGSDGTLRSNAVQAEVEGASFNNLLTTQNQSVSELRIISRSGENISVGENIQIDMGDFSPTDASSRVIFTVTASLTTGTTTEILRGDTLQETMRNLVSRLNNYIEDNTVTYREFGLEQLEAVLDGDAVVLRTLNTGPARDLTGGALDLIRAGASEFDVVEPLTGATGNATFDNGSATGGVYTNFVNNEDFIGRVDGFRAVYMQNDQLQMAVTIGDHTYTATVNDTNPQTDASIQFNSVDGGYFTIEMAANQGVSVQNQDQADAFATRLDLAFNELNFYQSRRLDLLPSSGVIGIEMELRSDDFSDLRFTDVTVTQATAANNNEASVSFVMNGETFTADREGGSRIGAYEILEFSSVQNNNRQLLLRNADIAFDLSNAETVATLEASLEKALNVGEISSLSFQVGTRNEDTIDIELQPISTDLLFGEDSDMNVQSITAARAADTLVSTAIDVITGRRAYVGAMQSRYEIAASNIQSAIGNLQNAHAVLADTDIATESTNFAMEQVRINASVAVIAQANQLKADSILRLIEG